MATIQFTISNIDTEEFSAKRTILKMSLGIILVFDLGKPETFQSLKNRIGEITQNAGYIPIVLMGTNKEAEADGVRIPSMDIDQFMFKHGINHYFRVSTKTGEGIQRTFEIMSDKIIKETIRKLGPEEVKRKTNFSFAIAMIGDKCIRKDWIAEFGVQRFAAPSHLGGAVSRKTLDRDIHHLITEPRMDKTPPPPTPAPQPAGGGGPSAPAKLRSAQLEELKQLKELKRGGTQEEEKKEIEVDVKLEKPKPLQPMEFKKADEVKELPEDLKTAIEKEVQRVREEIGDEKPPKPMKNGAPGAPPPPPGGPSTGLPPPPPSGPPKSISTPKRKAPPPPSAPAPEPTPSFSIKDVSMDDLAPPKKKEKERRKSKRKAKVMGAKLKRSPVLDMSHEAEPVPIDENDTVDEDSVKAALVKATKMHPDVVDELWESGVEGVDGSATDVGELVGALEEEGFSESEISENVSDLRDRIIDAEKEESERYIPSTPVVGDRPEYEEEVSVEEDESAEYEELPEEESEVGYGALAGGKEMEITTEKLLRKTTVFYRERMNPETLNKLAVILSSEKIYETLKIKIEEVARAATDKGLEIDKDLPIVDVVPEFPGCVCVPSVQHLNAEKEYDVANFLITPLQSGDIPDAKVKLYHKGKLIETIPTPTKVVKTTGAKISAGAAIIVPLLSQFPILANPVDNFLSGLIPFYPAIGGIEGIILILTGIFALISGLIYLFKRPKDAKPVETFPELDEKLQGRA